MNRYQKVFICIFRIIGILSLSHYLVAAGTAIFTMPGMFVVSLKMFAPALVISAFLIFGAALLAKIVTIGIPED